jgi:hypothetical protein
MDETQQPTGIDRRTLIKGAGIIGGAAWAAPMVLSMSPAYAAGSAPTGDCGCPEPGTTCINGNSSGTVCPGNQSADCFCWTRAEGGTVCGTFAETSTCNTDAECPTGSVCVVCDANTGCPCASTGRACSPICTDCVAPADAQQAGLSPGR